MSFLLWLQNTEFSTWTRESDWALFAFLIVHTIGMGFLAGTGTIVNLRVMGFGSQISPSLIPRLVPVMSYGLIAAILSGIMLVISYPAKALTNPLFYVKLAIIVVALLCTRMLARRFASATSPSFAKSIAVAAILLWIAGLSAGKFLAYTNKMLLVY